MVKLKTLRGGGSAEHKKKSLIDEINGFLPAAAVMGRLVASRNDVNEIEIVDGYGKRWELRAVIDTDRTYNLVTFYAQERS